MDNDEFDREIETALQSPPPTVEELSLKMIASHQIVLAETVTKTVSTLKTLADTMENMQGELKALQRIVDTLQRDGAHG